MGQLTEFGKVFIILIIGVVMVSITLFLSKILAPKKPTPLKLSSYECGEEPTGNSWVQFNTRFYIVGLVFLLFDVEMVFIFPWATVFGQKVLLAASPLWGWLTLAEMFVFAGILILGLVYVWRRGDLEWIKPEQKLPTTASNVPQALYDRINHDNYIVRPFTTESKAEEAVKAEPSAAVKAVFKPTFRRVQK